VSRGFGDLGLGPSSSLRYFDPGRLVVQAEERWVLIDPDTWQVIDEGDGAALPEPGGDRLGVVASDRQNVTVPGCPPLRVPEGLGVVSVWGWAGRGHLAAVCGEQWRYDPHTWSPIPVAESGPTGGPFRPSRPNAQTLVLVSLEDGETIELARFDAVDRIIDIQPYRGGVVVERYRSSPTGACFELTLEHIDRSGRRALCDLAPMTAGFAPAPTTNRFACLVSDHVLPPWPRAVIVDRDGVAQAQVLGHLRAEGRPLWSPSGTELIQRVWQGLSVDPAIVDLASGDCHIPERSRTHTSSVWVGDAGRRVAVVHEVSGRSAIAESSPQGKRDLVELSPRQADARLVNWTTHGADLEGIVITPSGTGPWPTVVDLHGGPNPGLILGELGHLSMWAAHGLAVFAPDHRGSGIAGPDAMRTQWTARTDRHGGSEASDVLAGIDHVIAAGIANPSRLYLYGHSHGAWLAAHLTTMTDRFRAAVTHEGIYDLRIAYLTRAANQAFADLLDGTPWEQPQRWSTASPISRAGEIRTPTLVVAGAHGSLNQAVAWWQALRDHEIDTDLVVYGDEGHTLQRYDNRVDVIRRAVTWFRDRSPT